MFDGEEQRPKPHVRYVKPALRGLKRPPAIPPTVDFVVPPHEPRTAVVATSSDTAVDAVQQSAELTPIKLARVKQIEAATDKVVAETELLLAQAEKELAAVKRIHEEIAQSRQLSRRQAEKDEVQWEVDELTNQERAVIRRLAFLSSASALLFAGVALVMAARGNAAFALAAGCFVAFTATTIKLGASMPRNPIKGEH